MASSPQWKLRRLAPRTLRIIERRKGEQPILAAYEATLVPAARSLIETYDAAGRYQSTWRKEMNEGRGASQALLTAMRGWLPIVQRDVPGFDGASYGDKPQVPDDVIEDAGRLCDVVAEHEADGKTPLTYAKSLLAAMVPLLQAAQKEWHEAEAADKKYQSLLAQSRAAAEAFDAQLKPFRRSLVSIVGNSDADYQKLRATRAHLSDTEDDAGAPSAPAPMPSVAQGVSTPQTR